MAERIKLVQGDNRPYITLTLTDSSGDAIDLSDGTTSVVVYFRAAGSTTVLATLATTKVDSGTTGKVMFNFPGTTLNVDAGAYEGEIEISFNGEKQTVYQTLKFVVREDFQ
jgi:hypothetical protein